MLSLRKLNRRGDTIIEVLVVLTVLSLAFSISYATANHGLQQSRSAEEHSEALSIANSQVELLRAAISKQTVLPQDGTQFCLTDTVHKQTDSDYQASCEGQRILYSQHIKYDTTTHAYIISITWDGVGTLGPQQEDLAYRVDAVAPAADKYTSGGPLATLVDPSPPGVYFVSKEVKPEGSTTKLKLNWVTTSPTGTAITSSTCKYDSQAAYNCLGINQTTQTYNTTGSTNESHTFSVNVFNGKSSALAKYVWRWITSITTQTIITGVYVYPVSWGYYCDWNGNCYEHICATCGVLYSYGTQTTDNSHWDYDALSSAPIVKPDPPRMSGVASGDRSDGAWVDVTVTGLPNAQAKVYATNGDTGAENSASVTLNASGTGTARVTVNTPFDGTTNTFKIAATQRDVTTGLTSDRTNSTINGSSSGTITSTGSGYIISFSATYHTVLTNSTGQ